MVTHGALGVIAAARPRDPAAGSAAAPSATPTPRYWQALPAGGQQSPVRFRDVQFVHTGHPIVRGMKDAFRTADALYRGMTYPPATEVLATFRADVTVRGDGRAEPVLFTAAYGKGRIFCDRLGPRPGGDARRRVCRHLRAERNGPPPEP